MDVISSRDQEGVFETPILLIFWRRPKAVTQVIESLRRLAPSQLYLAGDGPREGHEGEAGQVQMTREAVEAAIDWPCQVHRRYSDRNQGCKYGPSNAIGWFFENVTEGIILEEDCLPDDSFYSYCRSLLERYRDDTRVWQISGNNFLDDQWFGDGSYFFGGYTTTWGWATWRRCWQAYDPEMMAWSDVRRSGLLTNAFEAQDELEFWTRIWDRLTEQNYPVTWDYQWNYLCFANGGLSAIPNQNLVSNIGFGADGTHCLDETDPFAQLKSNDLGELIHPSLVLRNWQADRQLFTTLYQKPLNKTEKLKLEIFHTLKAIRQKIKMRP